MHHFCLKRLLPLDKNMGEKEDISTKGKKKIKFTAHVHTILL